MRWEDKPRKKTAREIVLEYIKFLKIMDFYRDFRYDFWKEPISFYDYYTNSISVSEKYYKSANKLMIEYLIERIKYFSYKGPKFSKYWMCTALNLDIYNVKTDLLWLYFKEKRIANCFVID